MRQAILIVAHGTRHARGIAESEDFIYRLRARLQRLASVVEHCFLELRQPTISVGVQHCLDAGVTDILVVPLLLFAAGHWQRDIPREFHDTLRDDTAIHVRIAPALGVNQTMVNLVANRIARHATRDAPPISNRILLVSRGSHDLLATEAFAAMAQQIEVGLADKIVPCTMSASVASAKTFLNFTVKTAAMTGIGSHPTEVLDEFAYQNTNPIVVVPYLLFSGTVSEELSNMVETWAARNPDVEVRRLPCLWPDDTLVDAFAAIARGAQVPVEK